jgi:hypothetical protein
LNNLFNSSNIPKRYFYKKNNFKIIYEFVMIQKK